MTQEITKLQRRPLTAKARLAQAFRISKQTDPLFPIVIHTTERGLQRAANTRGGREQAASIFDRTFDRVLSRHRNFRRDQSEFDSHQPGPAKGEDYRPDIFPARRPFPGMADSCSDDDQLDRHILGRLRLTRCASAN